MNCGCIDSKLKGIKGNMDSDQFILDETTKNGEFRVLLIEDNLDDEMLLKRAIKRMKANIKLDVVRDGHEAIEHLKKVTSIPHLIITDVNLPRMKGAAVVEYIKNNQRVNFIPVIVLTSSDEPNDIVSCMKAGASCYIKKTINMDQFTGKLESMLRFWLTMHESPYLPHIE